MTTVAEIDIEAPAAPPRPHRLRRCARPAAALCATAVLVGAAYQSWLLYQHHQSAVAAREAQHAAAHYAEILTTASPGTIDQQITRILDGSTGGFHQRYAKQSPELRELLLANQVTTTGSVVDSAVKSVDTGSATVLLFVRQSFTSATAKGAPAEPPDDITPMAITVQKTAGRWLVSEVTAGELPR